MVDDTEVGHVAQGVQIFEGDEKTKCRLSNGPDLEMSKSYSSSRKYEGCSHGHFAD